MLHESSMLACGSVQTEMTRSARCVPDPEPKHDIVLQKMNLAPDRPIAINSYIVIDNIPFRDTISLT